MMRFAISLLLLTQLCTAAPELPARVVTPSPVQPAGPAVAEMPPAMVAPAEATPAAAPVEEKAIPDAFPTARYEESWKKNPFLLKTAPITQIQESWGKDYVLTSMAEIGGIFRVSIKNKVTGESKRLMQGSEGDSEFKIVSVNLQPNRKESSVQISKGAETADLKYDETQLTPQGRNVAQGQAGGAARPGMPVIPGQAGGPGATPAAGRMTGAMGAGGLPPSRTTGAAAPNRMGGYQATPGAAGGNKGVPNFPGNLPSPMAGAGMGAGSTPVPAVRNTYSGQPAVTQAADVTSFPQPPQLPNLPLPSSMGVGGALPDPSTTVDTAVPVTETPVSTTNPVTRRRTLIPAPGTPQ